MNDASRLLAAALLGAVIAFTASAGGEQARDKPPKPAAYHDTCSQQLGLLFAEVSDLNRRLAAPDWHTTLDAELARTRSAQALQSIDSRLSEIERALDQLAIHEQFKH